MMLSEQVERYILDTYGVQADCPWFQYPQNRVFRHQSHGKWFALKMILPIAKLEGEGEGEIGVLNVKSDYDTIGRLVGKTGYYPAYHMCKTSWLTVALDGSVPISQVSSLIDQSYFLTRPKIKK